MKTNYYLNALEKSIEKWWTVDFGNGYYQTKSRDGTEHNWLYLLPKTTKEALQWTLNYYN
jgi:hypothetical protein